MVRGPRWSAVRDGPRKILILIVCVYVSITGYFLTGLFQKDRKNQNAKIVLMIKLEVAISLSRVIDFIHDDVALTGRKNWGKNYNYILFR